MSEDVAAEYNGVEATAFAQDHLQKVRAGNWEIEYLDPSTGDRWLMDYPHSEMHGGGPPRLRRLP